MGNDESRETYRLHHAIVCTQKHDHTTCQCLPRHATCKEGDPRRRNSGNTYYQLTRLYGRTALPLFSSSRRPDGRAPITTFYAGAKRIALLHAHSPFLSCILICCDIDCFIILLVARIPFSTCADGGPITILVDSAMSVHTNIRTKFARTEAARCSEDLEFSVLAAWCIVKRALDATE
jgi:hypothetical protein